MKYLKYFESLDTDEILDVFQDFIDEFSAIKWDALSAPSNIPYYIIEDAPDNYIIDIEYWTLDEVKRDKVSYEIDRYLKVNILSRFTSMGLEYCFDDSKEESFMEFGYKVSIHISKDMDD